MGPKEAEHVRLHKLRRNTFWKSRGNEGAKTYGLDIHADKGLSFLGKSRLIVFWERFCHHYPLEAFRRNRVPLWLLY